ncbi:hypothetical protein B0H10DRAFT_1950803 [Mycena sp. CBHHK59/15]|nr:hypothetical protein B0H10DRAFT_1950803 [Mycena sp. CBHHK59/15]
MVMQLAYQHLIGGGRETHKGGMYETASMRQFYKGLTVAIRVVSAESDRWAANMDEGIGHEERKQLFDVAVKKHGGTGKDHGDRAEHGICSLDGERFGVTHMTGHEGMSLSQSQLHHHVKEEMPNMEFCQEIACLADNLCNLHSDLFNRGASYRQSNVTSIQCPYDFTDDTFPPPGSTKVSADIVSTS